MFSFCLDITEIYNPSTFEWYTAGKPATDLFEPVEMGPSTLRPDGTVFVTGWNGNSSIFDSRTGK